MHILFLTHYFPPEGNAPASRTYEHCVRWVRKGHQVTVVTCVPNVPNGVPYNGYRNTWRTQEEEVDGIRVLRVWTYLAPNAGSARRIGNYLSYLFSAGTASLRITRPDVLIATSPQFFCGWAGVLSSWLRRIPFVLEIRDIWPESIETVGAMRSRPLLRVLETLERWMYRSATHLVTVGRGYRDKIVSKVPLEDRISLIYNGVDLSQFQPMDVRHVPWFDARLEGRFVCSYTGTLGMAHGLDVVVEAARRLKDQGRTDIVFCLVGDGAGRRELEAKVQDHGLTEMVVFLGQRPKEEIPTILARSNASLVHLMKCDLFRTTIPSKIFESMAMGKPIIMGVEGEALAIVLEAQAGLPMDPGCPESLTQAVLRLADDPTLHRELSANGREFVARSFNRDVFADEYLRILEAVADRKPVQSGDLNCLSSDSNHRDARVPEVTASRHG